MNTSISKREMTFAIMAKAALVTLRREGLDAKLALSCLEAVAAARAELAKFDRDFHAFLGSEPVQAEFTRQSEDMRFARDIGNLQKIARKVRVGNPNIA